MSRMNDNDFDIRTIRPGRPPGQPPVPMAVARRPMTDQQTSRTNITEALEALGLDDSVLDAIRQRNAAVKETAPYSPAGGWPDSPRICAADRHTLLAIIDRLAEVMRLLEQYGPSIVPHLLDTDDNPGERLRQALAAEPRSDVVTAPDEPHRFSPTRWNDADKDAAARLIVDGEARAASASVPPLDGGTLLERSLAAVAESGIYYDGETIEDLAAAGYIVVRADTPEQGRGDE